MQTDDVAARQQGGEIDALNAIWQHVWRQIESQHLRAESAAQFADAAANTPAADKSNRARAKQRAFRSRPFAGTHAAVHLRQLAQAGQHQTERQFGDGSDRRFGCIDDGDAASGCGRQIDVIETDTTARDDAQCRRVRKDVLVQRFEPSEDSDGLGTHETGDFRLGQGGARADW